MNLHSFSQFIKNAASSIKSCYKQAKKDYCKEYLEKQDKKDEQ
jgi:hypothetical protein